MARRKLSIDDKIEQQKLVVSKVKDRYEAELQIAPSIGRLCGA